ncbi:MAG: molybdopterin-guanine dinucleotide biosynthesis protein B [Thiobacillaceae bacterium]|nr:molybdopterin-guanine dinucleotide biosynthesis protein B [Thiobacillaceae bacterium]MCX7672852.1 molybdopterin-guanine dinucleotide biosynthesis protein B [Thiobacillaceae bacterium]MDW8324812.1 molybdopterin-guanine dinucleotide biosynthesis protein B [Burkholderiales bacterium]
MKLLAIVGYSGSGKTTLIERLLPWLRARGLTVSVIKASHHDIDPDPPGKDSWRFRQAGAQEVMLATPRRWVLTHELCGAALPGPLQLAARLAACDLVLAEGFRTADCAKLEVWRSGLARPCLYPTDPRILAVASDVPLAGIRRYDVDDIEAIGEFVLEFVRHHA